MRINPESPSYEEDRRALVKFGLEAIDPLIDRALDMPSNTLQHIQTEIMITEVLKQIDPAATMTEIEQRYQSADFKTKQSLWQLVIGIGAPHNKQFVLAQLDSLVADNIGFALMALHDYKNDSQMRVVLEKSLDSPNRFIRFAAASTVIEDSDKAIAVLEEFIANEGMPLNVRMQTVYTLSQGPSAKAKAALRRLKSVRNPQVRDLVSQVLVEMDIYRRRRIAR